MSVPPPDEIFRHHRAGGQGPSGPLSGDQGPSARPPLLERYGVRPVPGVVGAAELDITGPARNPWGILHGSLFALVVEAAMASARGQRRPRVRYVVRPRLVTVRR